jgi:hypothetical protein
MTSRKKAASSVAIGILVTLASLLGALNVGFVALWAAKQACGPNIVKQEQPKQHVKRKLFWKRPPPAPVPIQPEPSGFCRTVYRILDHIPLLAPPPPPPPPPSETCDEKKNPLLQKISSVFKRKQKTTMPSHTELATAFTEYKHPTKSQEKLIHQLALQFREYVNDTHHLEERLQNVSWGGTSAWWLGHDGGPTLLPSYLRVMDWPTDLKSTFPFGLCKQEPCPSAFALAHTFQWREAFQPWKMSPAAIHENRDGFVYVRGSAKSLSNRNDGHGMVWLRCGVHTNPPDPASYFRALLNALDMAVADNLHRSHNKVGKFNVVIDANGASFAMLPKLGDAKKGIVMLQDHYPNRLGMIVLANFSRVAEFLLTMIKPLITKEVRDKILILPKDADKRRDILETIVHEEYIPDYLGGIDTYRFNVKEYYSDKSLQFSDEEGIRYQTEMPYHA